MRGLGVGRNRVDAGAFQGGRRPRGGGRSSPLSIAISILAGDWRLAPRMAGMLSCSWWISCPAVVRRTREISPGMVSFSAGGMRFWGVAVT